MAIYGSILRIWKICDQWISLKTNLHTIKDGYLQFGSLYYKLAVWVVKVPEISYNPICVKDKHI